MNLDIVKYVVANIGTWIDPSVTAATGNIFMEQQPTEPDQCVCVYELPGVKPFRTFGNHFAWENPRLKITNRVSEEQGYGQAQADALAIWNLLKTVVNQSVNGVFYMIIDPVGNPAPQELDPNNRPVYVQEFTVMKYFDA